jgi:hypothetical protein
MVGGFQILPRFRIEMLMHRALGSLQFLSELWEGFVKDAHQQYESRVSSGQWSRWDQNWTLRVGLLDSSAGMCTAIRTHT